MKKEKKTFHNMVLAGLSIVLIVLLGNVMVKHKEDIIPHKEVGMDFLIGKAEQMLLPSFVYSFREQHIPWKYKGLTVGEISAPYISYVKQHTLYPEQVAYEDSILEILEQQEMDEGTSTIMDKVLEVKEKAQSTESQKVSVDSKKLSDYKYLLSNFYTVDSTTSIQKSQLNGTKLMAENMKIKKLEKGNEKDPQVLIYHTHSQEDFKDSKKGNSATTIVGVGEYLTKLLNDKYQINTLHHEGVYDLIDGKMDRSKAYQLSEKGVKKVLKKYPSIEVVIDLHRDGVPKSKHLVTSINGKKTAKIMFFNGLSYTKKNKKIAYLKNPYIQQNLAFSLQMQVAAKSKYPEFVRPIYLKGYRYNMHLCPKYLLIEAGAQTNTVSEMKNAMEITAEILDSVLKP